MSTGPAGRRPLRAGGVRLSASELDQFVAEQRRSAAVVGLESASVPGGMAELDGYYDAMQPRLHACAEAWQV